MKTKRALISVSDKTGIVELATRLVNAGVKILSTGGTAKTLKEAGIKITEVSDFTGFPEIMGGRIKTLHPKIHGGILARRGIDEKIMEEMKIKAIDLVIVNLYPFKQTIAKENVSLDEAIENIDIGGPAMIRAAAKNHQSVAVVVNPADYPEIAMAVESGELNQELRNKLALKAFRHTADYDRAISVYLAQKYGDEDDFPEEINLSFSLGQKLRYGENPHQKAAFYKANYPSGESLASALQLQGKPLSYNNYADADAALSTVIRFENPACVIVKHANPCGAAVAEDLTTAYAKAFKTDPTSAFGGIIAFNRIVDGALAHEIISRQFVEVILAPQFSPEALEIFNQKPNIRVLALNRDGIATRDYQIQSIKGGILLQEWDNKGLAADDLKVVSKREPTKKELSDLIFAWKVVQTVKSNAIVLAKDLATVGIGGGQTSRVFSSRIAVQKAKDEKLDTRGCVLAGDAFFPFRDGVDEAAKCGVSAIIQPGGSIRDNEVIQAANEYDIAMIFTSIRHFRH